MLPFNFKEADKSIEEDGLPLIPYYDNGVELICCFGLNAQERDIIAKTGKLWVRVQARAPLNPMTLTVFDPLRKIPPLEVLEGIAGRLIIHVDEDGEEIILYKIKAGESVNIATAFCDKISYCVYGADDEAWRYSYLLKLYGLDPAYTYILKRKF